MKTNTANPHAWLYAYLAPISGDSQERDENKKALIKDYSGGKTESLKEMYEKYPAAYRRMRASLSAGTRKQIDESLDKARKRLIAAIFDNLEKRNLSPDMSYVKRVACKGASVSRFNDIPLQTLKNLYNRFRNKNMQQEVNSLIKSLDL